MIELQNISFNFNQQVHVLDNATYTFQKGTFYTLSGSTEAARNVIFSLISGLAEPAFGRIIYNGKNIRQISSQDLLCKNIGFHVQLNRFIDYLSVRQNIEMAMDISVPEKKSKKVLINDVIEEVGFDLNMLSQKMVNLSSIQRLMINIAMVILCEKDTAFFNTSFDTNNEENREMIVNQLKKLAHDKNKCVILSTDSKEIAKLSDKIVVMKNGKLI